MSSYQVNEATLDIAAREVYKLRIWESRQDRPPSLGCETDSEMGQLTAIGQELSLLNAAAVAGRYRELPECSQAQHYRWESSFLTLSHVARYKAVRSLVYQCAEPPVFGTEPFIELERAGQGVDPSDHGFERLDVDFESGFHPGQDSDPSVIAEELESRGVERFLFEIESVGQFDASFCVWVDSEEIDKARGFERRDGDGFSPAQAAQAALRLWINPGI